MTIRGTLDPDFYRDGGGRERRILSCAIMTDTTIRHRLRLPRPDKSGFTFTLILSLKGERGIRKDNIIQARKDGILLPYFLL
jgi:hypothetical protein